ncbi:hypothetical protein Sste5346_006663 [Sporothrix stenoceras]|uniref:Uncharacterized protein n=1 Tax=Sporothrix stenoceras TaxID=5173 RepID=A0ABR3YXL5_9PEZI
MPTVLWRLDSPLARSDSDEANLDTDDNGKKLQLTVEEIQLQQFPVSTLPLGEPISQKRTFFWEKSEPFDLDAIATQPSVYDDPKLAIEYRPRADWENLHRFDPSMRWTWREEKALVRKIDFRILVFTCVAFMALEIDRANLAQALTNNFLADLNLTTNAGLEMMILWSIVAASQFRLSGRTSFLVTRSLLAILQGGFIPDMNLFMSYFYTSAELPIRLSMWWTSEIFAIIVGSFMAFGILHLDNHHGMPMGPPSQYLTLSLKGLGFSTFQTTLLVIPSNVLKMITLLAATRFAGWSRKLAFNGIIGQIWVLPCLVALYATDTSTENKWIVFAIVTILLGYPSNHSVQVGWVSRNANTACSVIYSNIYRADDAPRYLRGNRSLIIICISNIVLYLLVNFYYKWENFRRDKIWNGWTAEEREHYIKTTKDEGNKRLDFRFEY